MQRLHALFEIIRVHVFEPCPCHGLREVNPVEQSLDLDGRLGGAGQGALGALAGRAQAAEGALVAADVLGVGSGVGWEGSGEVWVYR